MAESIVKNLIYKFLLTFFKVISPLLIIPYVFRQISVSDMGEINFVVAFMTYFYVLGDLGLYVYSMREVSRMKNNPKEIEKFFSQTFFLRFITNSIAIVLYIITVKTYFHGIPNTLYIIVLLNMLGTFFNVEGFFEGLEKFGFITIKTIIIRLVSFILIFLFVKGEFAKYHYLYIGGGFLIANNLFSFVVIIKSIKFNFDDFQLIKHLAPQFYIFLMINAMLLYFQLDKVLLGLFSNNVEVGYYSLCEKLVLVISGFILTITQVTTPKLAYYGKSREYFMLLRRTTQILCLLIFPLVIGIFSLSNEIVTIFGGVHYEHIGSLLRIFSFYIFIYTFLEIIKTQIMLVNDKEKLFAVVFLIGGVFNLLIKYILLSKLNAELAIIITLLSMSITLFFLLIYTYLILEIRFLSKLCINYFLYSITLIGLYFIDTHDVYYNIFIKTTLGCIVYFGFLIARKDSNLQEIYNALKKLLTK